MSNPIYKIRVPATSANIGSGFDTLGIAFDLYNNYYIQELDEDKLVIEGIDERFQNEDNLVYKAMNIVFDKVGYRPKGIYIKEECDIPVGKGFGSSAACIVAGLIGANLISGNKLSNNDLLKIAIEIEGHPDNVAPAMLGNLTSSMMLPNETITITKRPNPIYNFYAFIPDFELETDKARKILPQVYDIKDAVFNISHALITFEALVNGEYDILQQALDDRLHEPYRKELIDGYDKITDLKNNKDYVGSYLSGAGPSIVVISTLKEENFKDHLEDFIKENLPTWEFVELKPDKTGSISEIIED